MKVDNDVHFQVAAVSGDARRALAICLRAAESAQRKLEDPDCSKATISMADIDAAIAGMFQPPKIKAIRWVMNVGGNLL